MNIINDLQNKGTWGDAIIPKLPRDIINELLEIKDFSERNIKFMSQFFKVVILYKFLHL
ncbi:MAG: DUF1016 N-terminal domain-containing protein [Candidatus Sericytochromatia bacterium]